MSHACGLGAVDRSLPSAYILAYSLQPWPTALVFSWDTPTIWSHGSCTWFTWLPMLGHNAPGTDANSYVPAGMNATSIWEEVWYVL